VSNKNCGLCTNPLDDKPSLTYINMPRSAQHFPTPETLAEDLPINLKIVQCSACGLVQLDNEPVSYYREVIRASAFSKEMGEFRQRQFANFVKKYNLHFKKVIEIGCGRGEYLSLMNQQGVQGYGLEYAPKSIQNCLEQGLQVEQGYIENEHTLLSQQPFDAFFILNFLEHLPKPINVLRGIAANLTVDAVGLVEVPNFDMMVRENLFTEFVTDHLWYFTRDTLYLLLNLSGFEVLECEEIWEDYILSATVRKRKKLDVAGFEMAHQDLTTQLHEFINLFPSGQVAIWGAGHQALAVIAVTELTSKIKYVVDSASFKQNKLTPATHLPIVSPDIFFQDTAIEAVIVMAAAYSDEVMEVIKKQTKKVIQIAILKAFGLKIISH
jgi:SAM-dependent methyltransferase